MYNNAFREVIDFCKIYYSFNFCVCVVCGRRAVESTVLPKRKRSSISKFLVAFVYKIHFRLQGTKLRVFVVIRCILTSTWSQCDCATESVRTTRVCSFAARISGKWLSLLLHVESDRRSLYMLIVSSV